MEAVGTPSTSPDWPSLFPPGFHPVTIEVLRASCVQAFPLSSTRAPIMRGLEAILERLRESSIPCEVWVDGSFVTRKLDPQDSDILVCVKGATYNSASPAQRGVIQWIIGNLKGTHLCDSYVLVEFDPPHPLSAESAKWRAYWRGWFAFNRAEEPKGIALLRLG
jgi:hypothetical protein